MFNTIKANKKESKDRENLRRAMCLIVRLKRHTYWDSESDEGFKAHEDAEAFIEKMRKDWNK